MSEAMKCEAADTCEEPAVLVLDITDEVSRWEMPVCVGHSEDARWCEDWTILDYRYV